MERADAAHEDAGREHARERGREQPVGDALADAEAMDEIHDQIVAAECKSCVGKSRLSRSANAALRRHRVENRSLGPRGPA